MSKGSNRRPEDAEAIAANWDDIDWGKKDAEEEDEEDSSS